MSNTIVYGRDVNEVTCYVQKIKETIPSVFTLSAGNLAHLSEIVEKRIRVQKEQENIKYYDSILEHVNPEEYKRIVALRDQSFEFIRDYNVYELHRFTNIVIVVDNCERYSEFVLRVLINSIDINVNVIVACNSLKMLKPHIRTAFQNIVLLDKDTAQQYVFSLSNMCHKKIREDAQILINNGYNKMIISKVDTKIIAI